MLIDAPTLTVLAARAREMLAKLQARGHASQDAFALTGELAPWAADKLPEELTQARREKNWSSFNGENATDAARRRESTAQKLAEKLKF